MYSRTYTHLLVDTCTYTCICTHTHTFVQSCMHVCIHTHIHVFMSIYTQVYIPLRTELGFFLVFCPYGDNSWCLVKAAVSGSVLQCTPVKPNPHTKAVTSRAFGVWLGHWGLPFTDARELSSGDQGHRVWGEDSARSKSACTLMWSFPPRELWELILLFTNYPLYVVYNNANGLSQKANYRLTP